MVTRICAQRSWVEILEARAALEAASAVQD
jgi:hypothetical protein